MSKERLKNIPKHLMEDTTDIESDKNARQLSNKTREKDDIDEKERQENVRRILQKKVSLAGATVLTENLINRKNPSVELIRHEPLLKKRKIVDDENKDANKKIYYEDSYNDQKLKKKDEKIKYLEQRNARLEKLLENEQAEKKELFALNIELQKTVINQFSAAQTSLSDLKKEIKSMANSSGKECSDIVGKIDNGKIHLGYGIYLCTEKYYAISNKADSSRIAKKSSNKACLFVKEIAIAIFGSKTLLGKTVTGCESNRTKNKKSKQVKPDNTDTTGNKLDPTKVLAIKEFTRWWCLNVKKISVIDADEEYYKVTTYIAHKISEIKRQHEKDEKIARAISKSSNLSNVTITERASALDHDNENEALEQPTDEDSEALSLGERNDEDIKAQQKDKVTPPETSDETSLSTKEILSEHQEESDQFKKIALCDNDSVQSTSNRISTSLSNTTLSDSVQSTSNRKSMSLSNTSLSSSSLDYSSHQE